MSYQKFLVDNPQCSRRFHCTFDDEAAAEPMTQVSCPHCGVIVFSAENHPPVTLAREENLVKLTDLSRKTVSVCKFKDAFKNPHRI